MNSPCWGGWGPVGFTQVDALQRGQWSPDLLSSLHRSLQVDGVFLGRGMVVLVLRHEGTGL